MTLKIVVPTSGNLLTKPWAGAFTLTNPAVSKSVEEFTKYMDEKAIEELFE